MKPLRDMARQETANAYVSQIEADILNSNEPQTFNPKNIQEITVNGQKGNRNRPIHDWLI